MSGRLKVVSARKRLACVSTAAYIYSKGGLSMFLEQGEVIDEISPKLVMGA